MLQLFQYLAFQCIDRLDVRKVFGTVLTERTRGHLKDEGSKEDEAFGSGWELCRQFAPALFRQISIHTLPFTRLNRNVTDDKQHPCREQGGIRRSVGEKVKRTTSRNGKNRRI